MGGIEMKKLAILILVAVSLFFMTACGDNKDKMKDARDEAIFRSEFVFRLSGEPEELAEFLLATNELDAFVEVDTEDHSKTIENAVVVFSEDEDIHQKALERAKEVFAEMHIYCNWGELRKIAPKSIDFETYEEYEAYMEQKYDLTSCN